MRRDWAPSENIPSQSHSFVLASQGDRTLLELSSQAQGGIIVQLQQSLQKCRKSEAHYGACQQIQ